MNTVIEEETERMTIEEWIARYFPERNENRLLRIYLWNAIGAERRRRIRQVKRYPYNRRFIVPQDDAV